MNLEDRDAGSFVEEARAKIAQIELPAGYYLEWGGQFESLQAATARLSIVVPLDFVAIFVLLFMALGAGGRADRKSVVWGKRVSVSVGLCGRRILKKKKQIM